MKKLIERFKAETPTFWRKITYMCLSVKGACASVMGLEYLNVIPTQLTTTVAIVGSIAVFITAYAEAQVKKDK